MVNKLTNCKEGRTPLSCSECKHIIECDDYKKFDKMLQNFHLVNSTMNYNSFSSSPNAAVSTSWVILPHLELRSQLLYLIAVFSCVSVSRPSMVNGQNIIIVTWTQWLELQPAAEGHSTSCKSSDGLQRWSGNLKCNYYQFHCHGELICR